MKTLESASSIVEVFQIVWLSFALSCSPLDAYYNFSGCNEMCIGTQCEHNVSFVLLHNYCIVSTNFNAVKYRAVWLITP